jgi:hypothetical protein
VARPGVVDPDDAALVVYQVPNPPAAGHFELPTIESTAFHCSCSQLTVQAVLAF